jgi:hypothetical protein
MTNGSKPPRKSPHRLAVVTRGRIRARSSRARNSRLGSARINLNEGTRHLVSPRSEQFPLTKYVAPPAVRHLLTIIGRGRRIDVSS